MEQSIYPGLLRLLLNDKRLQEMQAVTCEQDVTKYLYPGVQSAVSELLRKQKKKKGVVLEDYNDKVIEFSTVGAAVNLLVLRGLIANAIGVQLQKKGSGIHLDFHLGGNR
jgi:hypothetical protein